MHQSTGYLDTNPRHRAIDAAEQFAAKFWANPRTIEEWRNACFRLVDGTRWYMPRLTDAGFEIVVVENP